MRQKEVQKTKQELNSNLSFNMALNKPSGLSLEQFKKILNDPKDKNKIFCRQIKKNVLEIIASE
jgi:hypothetical protein